MATVIVTVPDVEVDTFLMLLKTNPMLSKRIVTVERLSKSVEDSNAKHSKFMDVIDYVGGKG